ncbi:MAG: hypothetical protein ACRDAM_15950 [Casimicrobium sp.]
MHCPTCHHTEHTVHRTSPAANGAIRRVRACAKCRGRWVTTELPEQELKRLRELDAALQPFIERKAA